MEKITPLESSLMAFQMAENESILNLTNIPIEDEGDTAEDWYRELAEGYICKIMAQHTIVSNADGQPLSVAETLPIWGELIPLLMTALQHRAKVVRFFSKTSRI